MKRNKYSRYRKPTSLPSLWGGGYTPHSTAKVNIPSFTTSASNTGSSVDYLGLADVASSLGSAAMSGQNVGSAVVSALPGTVSSLSSALGSAAQNLPLIGIGDQIVGGIGDAIKSNNPVTAEGGGKDAYMFASMLDPVGSLEKAAEGEEGWGWDLLAGLTAGTPLAVWGNIESYNLQKEKAIEADRLRQNELKKQMTQADKRFNPGRYYNTNQMMMAAYGGPLSQPMQNMQQMGQPNQMPQVTEYNTGGTHEESLTGGIPVDSEGNSATVSGGRAIALTEAGEVAWKNPKSSEVYVFSDKIFI